jgi:glycosyltransferase involved in cell wall biosynthesis
VSPVDEPHVSVCIRAHGRPAELAATIASVLEQSYRDFEVVVSDDSGEVQDVAEGFGDARVRYFRNPAPSGAAGNLTHAVTRSRGRLIAILNDDDLWLPEFLAEAVGVLERNPDVGLVFTDDYYEVGTKRVRRDLPFRPGRHEQFLRQLLEHSMPASATLMRRAAWDEGERAVPLTPLMVGDVMAWLRTAAAGWPFYYLAEPLAVSRLHGGQVSLSEAGLPARMIATFEAFRFDDPVCESLRRARLAESFLARAHAHLTRRRFGDAWRDVGRAHRAAPRPMGIRALLALSGLRGAAMRWVISHPRLLGPLLGTWRRVRPPVLPH